MFKHDVLRGGRWGVFTCHPGHVLSIPQGSVLGPLLFILYMAELADIAAQHKTIHCIRLQLYIHCQPDDVSQLQPRGEMCQNY